MLGEIHSLINDFPEMEDAIMKLSKTDDKFQALNEKYDLVDEKIRQLELQASPVADDAMHVLKHERAELKDKLYQALVSAKGQGAVRE